MRRASIRSSRTRSRTCRRSRSTCVWTPIPTAAIADALSKINQVRGVLPRDANDPVVSQADRPGLRPHVPVVQFEGDDVVADHRLSDARRAAPPADRRRRRQRADPRRTDLRHAHLAGSDPHGGARRHARATSAAALAANNFTTAAGEIKSDYTQVSVNALTSLDNAQAFGQLVSRRAATRSFGWASVAKIELGP